VERILRWEIWRWWVEREVGGGFNIPCCAERVGGGRWRELAEGKCFTVVYVGCLLMPCPRLPPYCRVNLYQNHWSLNCDGGS